MNFCAAEHRNWRLNLGFPRNDPKRYQIFILGLICPREPVLVMVDGKIYYFQVITGPLFSTLARNNCNNGRNWSDKYKILRRAMLWACMHVGVIYMLLQSGYLILRCLRADRQACIGYTDITLFSKRAVARGSMSTKRRRIRTHSRHTSKWHTWRRLL